MAVKVFINIKGEKMGGSYEVTNWPPAAVDGFIEAIRLVKKDGSRKEILLAVDQIARIEKAPIQHDSGNYSVGNIPDEPEEEE